MVVNSEHGKQFGFYRNVICMWTAAGYGAGEAPDGFLEEEALEMHLGEPAGLQKREGSLPEKSSGPCDVKDLKCLLHLLFLL